MRKIYKNAELNSMLKSMEKVLRHSGRVGYAAARNTRLIQDALTEFYNVQFKLLEKYGEKELDEKGEETGNIKLKIGTPGFERFYKELEPYLGIQHEVDIMQISTDDIAQLTGEEILAVDWMIKEAE